MICENCGAKIRNRESYCPRCGTELFDFEHKPLQKKFLRGEYRDQDEVEIAPYNLEEDYSKETYQKEPYQNWDDQDPDFAQGNEEKNGLNEEYHQNHDYNQDKSHKTDYTGDGDYKNNYKGNKPYKKNYDPNKNYNKKYNQDQSSDRNYDDKRGHNNKSNQRKGSKRDYNKKGYHKQKKYPTKVYNLDEYEPQQKQSSVWGTVILFLVLALLIGFVMGFIFFSGKIQNLF